MSEDESKAIYEATMPTNSEEIKYLKRNSITMTHKKAFHYAPLLVFQLILLGLFFGFVRYRTYMTGDNRSPAGFEDTHVMIFIGFGFLMTFLKKYCYSALGFNWLLAALVVQWALFCQNLFDIHDGVIYISKLKLLEADIMAATVLITFGALLGVASGLQLIFIAIVETVIACVNIFLVLEVFHAADIGGSIAIHAFGAYFGLACSFAMNKGKKKEAPETTNANVLVKLDEPTYVSDVTAMIGSIFLWIYWPTFNSALANSEAERERAVINTYLSLAAATVTTFTVSSLVSHEEGKFDMVHVQNSTLAGGVAVGAVANMMISPGGAIAIGIVSGIISVLGYKFLTPKLANIGILDTCGVNNLHGMPAVFSGILSIIFAAVSSVENYGYFDDLYKVFPAMDSKEESPRSSGKQALYQLAALAATLVISSVGGFITGLIARRFRPLKVDERYDDQKDWELPAGH